MFTTIFLSNFYLQAIARHQPALRQQPLAVLDDTATKAIILQLNDAAEVAGVRAGMAPSQALARCLQLVIKARSREREQQITEILLHHAFMLSPFVEATAPGVCTVHFTSTKNCRANVEAVVRQLAELQLSAQAGLAPTPDLSFLAACLAQPVLQIDDPEDFLAPLPIETLRYLPHL